MKLFDYQLRNVVSVRSAIQGGARRVLLHLPTGAGKTIIASEMMRGHEARGGRPWFIVSRKILIDQTVDKLSLFGVKPGVIQAQHYLTNPFRQSQVASIQTLARRDMPSSGPTLIIIDEAHEMHRTHKEVMETYPNAMVVGLTATPWRKGLASMYDHVVSETMPSELIDSGRLVRSVVYAPDKPDMSHAKSRGEDYTHAEAEKGMEPLHGSIIRHWIDLAEGRPTFMFCVNVAHSMAMVGRMKAEGIAAIHIDQSTPDEEREEARGMLREGQVDVLSSCGVLTTGVDEPSASCAIFAAATRSAMKHHQCWGRVLRSHPGKKDALILDHAGNVQRMIDMGMPALPQDIEPVTLEDGKVKPKVERKKTEREKREASPCPKCKKVPERPSRICPSCGYEKVPKNLIEETTETLKPIETTATSQADWYSGLLWEARRRGFKDGWAAHKYKEKFKDWPPRTAQPAPPNPEVKRYIQYLNIKAAKARQS